MGFGRNVVSRTSGAGRQTAVYLKLKLVGVPRLPEQKDVMQHIPKKRKRTWNPGPRWNPSEHNDEVAEVEFPQPYEAEDVFRAMAARIRVFRGLASFVV